MRRQAVLAVALTLAAGCAGPSRPVDLGFREVPTRIVLGAPPVTALPAPGAVRTVPVPLPPGILTLPPPPFPTQPRPGSAPPPPVSLPPQPSCPPGDPLAAPAEVAPNSVPAPPANAAYLFHNTGSYRVSGADARSGRFPDTTLRTFGHVVRYGAGQFSYDVTERLADTTTTTTYLILDTGTTAQSAGIYLTAMHSRRDDGTTASFVPVPSLEIVALPLVSGATLNSQGADPSSQTAEAFTSTIRGKARVHACGVPLDTWQVELSQGQVLSPSQNLTFDSTYWLAPQFGGLSVQDSIAFTGTDGGAGLSRTDRAVITSVPRTP